MKTWEVTLTFERTATVIVKARTEGEARMKGEAKFAGMTEERRAWNTVSDRLTGTVAADLGES